LGLAFGLLIGLLITVGNLGVRRMDQIDAGLEDITGGQWAKIRLSREAMSYFNLDNRITMRVFLLKDKDKERINSLLSDRAEHTKRISTLEAQLEGLCKSEEEKRLLEVIHQRSGPYIASYGRVLRHILIDQKKPDAAAAVMVQQTAPALLAYHDAWDEFVRFQGDQLQLAARQSRARYTAARRSAVFVIVIAVGLAAAIALFVIKRMVREITTILRTEKEALRTAHREAEIFINAVPSILIGLDRDLRITRWNLTASCVFGFSMADAVGMQLSDCGVKWLRPDMPEEIRSWCAVRGSRRCDQVPFEINGKTRLLGLTITPVRRTEEDLSEILVIGTDTTDRNMLEEQLRQAQKLESVGQLAAGIAHEINTPTQYIGDNVQFLKTAFHDLKCLLTNYEGLLAAAKGDTLSPETLKGVIDAVERADSAYLLEEIPKAIEQTVEGIDRVSKLVGAMKEFSHPGTKEKASLDLNRAIESTITVSRNEWKYVADVETDFDKSMPMVSCHPGQFNQVILNLIINAAHAIADVADKGGSARGTITIQTRNCGEWAEIRIEDTGSGIPENVRSRIFDPFFTTKEIGKGTGQGLAIARSVVVDRHGGTIHFETEDGKGTTFIVRIPQDGRTLAAKGSSA
jgi:PAS domain S-box-containing protein